MFEHILLAYDGSAGAKKALQAALHLAQLSQTGVFALAVEERLPRLAATVGEMEEAKEAANHFYQDQLSAAFLQALAANVPFQSTIRIGHAARTIIDVAKEQHADLLVLGSSGHSNVWGRFLGTTAEKVSRHAPCTVLLVR